MTFFKTRMMDFLIALVQLAIILKMSALCSGDPEGFITIDCGSTQRRYTDSRTNLTWKGDEPYILTGNNGAISQSLQSTLNSSFENREALKSFRYFPLPRQKYCYELSTGKSNTTFLIRAMFLHGQSPVLQRSLRFQVYIQGTLWIQVQYGMEDEYDFNFMEPEIREGIYFSTREKVINICLVPETNVIPFISSLELREMEFGSYADALTDGLWRRSFLLSSLLRENVAADGSRTVRYPDDSYDRLWTSSTNSKHEFQVGSAVKPHNIPRATLKGLNNLPIKVTEDAWEWEQGYGIPIEFYVEYPFSPVPNSLACYIFYFHANQSSLDLDNAIIIQEGEGYDTIGTFKITSQTTMKYLFHEVTQNWTHYYFTIPPSSIEPQILALEVYLQEELVNEGLLAHGEYFVKFIKETLNLSDWQGDACIPKPYDWLTCSRHGDEIFVESITLSHLSNVDDLMKYYSYTAFSEDVTIPSWSITNSNLGDNTTIYLFNNNYIWSGTIMHLNVSYNNITSQFFNKTRWVMQNFTNLAPLRFIESFDVSHNNLGEEFLQADLKAFFFDKLLGTNLQVLNFSNNGVAGEVPDYFWSFLFNSNATGFKKLSFDDNAITGKLNFTTWYNEAQATFRNSSSTNDSDNVFHQLFSFVNNDISDIIPSLKELEYKMNVSLLIERFNNTEGGLLLGGNPFCKSAKSLLHRYLCRSSTNDMSYAYTKKKRSKLPIIAGVLGGIPVLCAGCILSAIIWRLRRQVVILQQFQQVTIYTVAREYDTKPDLSEPLPLELLNRKVQPPFFSYHDLKIATRDFHDDNKLGSGAFGAVYKGVLQDKREVAVKKLFNSDKEVQVLNDFLNEVVLLTGIKHRNLVQLLGCCVNDKERILVYEYAEKGNVADALWGQAAKLLSWEERLNICVGVAWGLSYLHKELQPGIIHRDIKAANVLIDKNLSPKIADFGLAKLFREEETQAQFTFLAGTRGYLAPEYILDGILTDKADVYSFGILALELVSGRNCIDLTQPEDKVSLKNWAENLQGQGKLLELLPPGLEEKYPSEEVTKVINIALLCVGREPRLRPTMTQVAVMLTGTSDDTMFLSFNEKRCPPEILTFDFGRESGDRSERVSLIPLARESSTGSQCQMDDREEDALINSREMKSSGASSTVNQHDGEDSLTPTFQERVASFSRSLSKKIRLP